MTLALLTILAAAALSTGIAIEVVVLIALGAVALLGLAICNGARCAGEVRRHVFWD